MDEIIKDLEKEETNKNICTSCKYRFACKKKYRHEYNKMNRINDKIAVRWECPLTWDVPLEEVEKYLNLIETEIIFQ